MIVIRARNTNDAIPKMVNLLRSVGRENQGFIESPDPVSIVITHPTERLCFAQGYDPYWETMLGETISLVAESYKDLKAVPMGRGIHQDNTNTFILRDESVDLVAHYASGEASDPEDFLGDSILLELLSGFQGKTPGTMTITYATLKKHKECDNWHLADKVPDSIEGPFCPYSLGEMKALPIMLEDGLLCSDLQLYSETGGTAIGYRSHFFRRLVVPVRKIGEALMDEDKLLALSYATNIVYPDWKEVMTRWITSH